MSEVELLVDANAIVGEGPVWDPASGVLWWVDIPTGRVHRYSPDDGESTFFDIDGIVGAIAPSAGGGFVAALEHDFAMIQDETIVSRIPVSGDTAPSRFNDAACDRSGRFWAGRVPHDVRGNPGTGSLWRLEGETPTKVLDGLSLANGIDWSPDGKTMYLVDSAAFALFAFDFDEASGTVSNQRSLVTFPEQWDPLCVPDGMCVDAEGSLWVAFWGGADVRRFAPDGSLMSRIQLPVSLVTACAFGGADLTDLYITTAAATGEPGSGGLWCAHPGVAGLPSTPFAG